MNLDSCCIFIILDPCDSSVYFESHDYMVKLVERSLMDDLKELFNSKKNSSIILWVTDCSIEYFLTLMNYLKSLFILLSLINLLCLPCSIKRETLRN